MLPVWSVNSIWIRTGAPFSGVASIITNGHFNGIKKAGASSFLIMSA